jgi:hypothetical protein
MSRRFEKETKRESPFVSSLAQQQRTDRVNKANFALESEKSHGRLSKAENKVAHMAKIREFHEALYEAYPANFGTCMKNLKARHVEGLDIAITFLEDDPWFFRSGYMKARLLYYIAKIELSEDYKIRLRRIIINVVDHCYRLEFRSYSRLAKYVSDGSFIAQLQGRINEPDSHVRRRAQWVLDALSQNKRPTS